MDLTETDMDRTPTERAPVIAPLWLKMILVISALWLGVELVRGVTIALTGTEIGVQASRMQ